MKSVLFIVLITIVAIMFASSGCKANRHDSTQVLDVSCKQTTCTRAEEGNTCYDVKEQVTRICTECRVVSIYDRQPPNPDCPVMDAAINSEPSPSYTSTIGAPGTSLQLPCDRKHQGEKRYVPEIKSTLVCYECLWINESGEGKFINHNCRWPEE